MRRHHFSDVWLTLTLALTMSVPAAATDQRKSGFEFMSPATQSMQRDDAQNPAMLWVKDGESLWNQAPGKAAKSCAACHGEAAKSMRGIAATYPSFDADAKRPVNLSERINLCRKNRQQQSPWPPEHAALLSLESYVALQSRGLTIAPYRDARLSPFFRRGEQLFKQRMGQLDLACAHCHDQHAGGRLGGAPIPQAHPTGYPIYRLEWQGMGSLQRRIRTCMTGVRAEPFAFNSPEMAELETYLAARAAGMAMDAPGVRP
jgi:sulfur-oxidizing protein SoxA